MMCLDIRMWMMRKGRLKWFGHVEWKEEGKWVPDCRNLNVEGIRRKGRRRKTWDECTRNDMREMGLSRDDESFSCMHRRRQVFKSGTAFNIEAKKWDGNCRPCPIGGDAYGYMEEMY